MASLILGAGALAYDQVQKTRARRKARRDQHNEIRFGELERENAERMAGLQQHTERGAEHARRREEPPAYVDVTGGGERRRRSGEEEEEEGGEEGDAAAAQGRGVVRQEERETEVERLRINEERRKGMGKEKGYRRLFGRKKGGGQEGAIA